MSPLIAFIVLPGLKREIVSHLVDIFYFLCFSVIKNYFQKSFPGIKFDWKRNQLNSVQNKTFGDDYMAFAYIQLSVRM